jgi:hypothetical protein
MQSLEGSSDDEEARLRAKEVRRLATQLAEQQEVRSSRAASVFM